MFITVIAVSVFSGVRRCHILHVARLANTKDDGECGTVRASNGVLGVVRNDTRSCSVYICSLLSSIHSRNARSSSAIDASVSVWSAVVWTGINDVVWTGINDVVWTGINDVVWTGINDVVRTGINDVVWTGINDVVCCCCSAHCVFSNVSSLSPSTRTSHNTTNNAKSLSQWTPLCTVMCCSFPLSSLPSRLLTWPIVHREFLLDALPFLCRVFSVQQSTPIVLTYSQARPTKKPLCKLNPLRGAGCHSERDLAFTRDNENRNSVVTKNIFIM